MTNKLKISEAKRRLSGV